MRRFETLRTWLDVSSTLAIVAVSASVLWSVHMKPASEAGTADPDPQPARPSQGLPSDPVSIDNAQRLGRSDAPFVIVQYSDFQCPYCASVAREGVPTLVDRYINAGKLQLIFRHLPLDRLHPLARQAAEAAECAGGQGKFWQMHDVLFNQTTPLKASAFGSYAKTIGLDVPRFKKCVTEHEMAQRVSRDSDEAARFQISSTPTFLLGMRQADGRVKVVRRATGGNVGLLVKAIDETFSTVR